MTSKLSPPLLLLFALACLGSCFSMPPAACTTPLIVEFVNNYQIPTDDLSFLVSTNLSSFTLQPITAKKGVKFSEVKVKSVYLGGKSVSPSGPYSVQVADDGITMTFEWVANVTKDFILHDIFNVTAEVSRASVGYLKSYSQTDNIFSVSGVKIVLPASGISIKTITPGPKDGEKTKIEAAVKDQLTTALANQLKSLQTWMNDNAKTQRIASIYPSPNYNYDYRQVFSLSIDTKTLTLTSDGEGNYVSGYKGSIVGQVDEKCSPGVPPKTKDYRLFISDSFVNNFAKAVQQRFKAYQQVLIDQTTVRTQTFQWRLIDLESILDGFAPKYGKYYMNKVNFKCSLQQVGDATFDSLGLSMVNQWLCGGYLITEPGTVQQIMDMTVNVFHSFQVSVLNSDSLSVYQKPGVRDIEFRPVDGVTVKNEKLAVLYTRQFMNDLQGYTVGSYFRVGPGSNQVEIQRAEGMGGGLWIG